jgi:O-antigen/teichoic acid export membrane protein
MSEVDTEASDRNQQALGRQLRGSSLLLAGRMLSKFVNFGVQIAIVRMLTKDDFGAFAYGIALAASGEVVCKLGLGRGANRYVPFYAERGERHLVMGTLALVCGTIVSVGAVAFGVLYWMSGLGWAGFPAGEGGRIVLILAALAPVQALDTICIQTLACYSKPRAIFFRKHVIGPGLRATAVAACFLAGGSDEVLALAYLAGGVVGVVVSLHLTWTELHAHGVLPLPLGEWRVPWRPLFRYSIPLLSSDLVFITLTAVTTVLLMATHGERGVASMRAVVPAAGLNMLVAQSFALLFLPTAVRVYAQGDLESLRLHHWQSSAWVAVLSFPIFALTFGVAPQLVTLLLGDAYAASAGLLAMLAFGHYVSICMGFNSEMLQVFARTRAIVGSDVTMIVLGGGLAALLCPEYGALGAVIAVTVARLAGTVARQLAILRTTGLGPVPPSFLGIWLRVAVASVLVTLIGWLWQPPLVVQLALLAVVALVLLRSTAHALDIERSFPQLQRLPLLSRLAGT